METQSAINQTEHRPAPPGARPPAGAPQGELSARVVDSLGAFSDEELDRVTEGSSIFFDRRWYRLLDGLELGQLVRAPVSFRYVVVSRGAVPVAICPFFITRDPSIHYVYSFDKSFFTSWEEDLARINPEMASLGRWAARAVDGIRRAARLAGVRTDTWLVAASPLSFRGSISVAALPDEERRQALDSAITKLKEISEAEGAPIWFYRIPDEERGLRASLAAAGFDETFALYEPLLDELADGVPGFLARFRGDLRRECQRDMRKIQRVVQFEVVRDIAGLEPEFTALYEATYAKFGSERFAQPPSFWSDVGRHLGPQAEFVLARRGAHLVGFLLLLHKRNDLWAYRFGKLEGEDAIPLLYFSLACYEPVRRAHALGARRLWLGPGSWATKRRRGAAGYALHNAFYFPSRGVRAVLLPYLRLFSSVARGQLERVTKPSANLKPIPPGAGKGVHS
jgi:predicted N-acyltransferase